VPHSASKPHLVTSPTPTPMCRVIEVANKLRDNRKFDYDHKVLGGGKIL